MRIRDTRFKEKLVSHEDRDNNSGVPSAFHMINPSDFRFSVKWNKNFMLRFSSLVYLDLHPIRGATIITNIEHHWRLKGKPESHDDRDRDKNEFRMFNSIFIANICTLVKSHRLQFFFMSHDENQLIKCLILLVLAQSSCDSRFLSRRFSPFPFFGLAEESHVVAASSGCSEEED